MKNNNHILMYKYHILVQGHAKELNILGWRNALYRAKSYTQDLFNPHVKVEILNTGTGEIVTIQEALARTECAANSATT